jgi:chaperonin GroES
MAKTVNITPLHDRVIVKPAPAEEKTAGGIIIPDTAKEKPQRGTVMAAGPGKKDEPMSVKTGDSILYGKYAGTEVSFEGEDTSSCAKAISWRLSKNPLPSLKLRQTSLKELANI